MPTPTDPPLVEVEPRVHAGAVRALASRAAHADGVAPLDEATLLALRAGSGATHLVVRAGRRLVGYAQLRTAGERVVAELVVDPAHRRAGLGAALLAAARHRHAAAPLEVWAHGDLPAARALAVRTGAARTRELLVMSAPLAGRTGPQPPTGVRLRGFVVGADEPAWLAVNSRAFADHPEQGRLTRADLRAREHEPWFDPAGLLLAVDEQDELLGFCWTKVHPAGVHGPDPVGELYVVGVDPPAQGRGLGAVLTTAGLAHLAGLGLGTAVLYVEAEHTVARRTYAAAGFVVTGTHARYRWAPDTPRSPSGATMTPMTDAPPLPRALAAEIAEHLADDGVAARPTDGPAAQTAAEPAPLPADRFSDRELSWLAFNQRVLELAEDPTIPLLERVRFLAIFASNLDEFFMVRVAGLKRRIATGIAVTAASGLSPRQVLEAISATSHELMARHAAVFADQVAPALAAEGITLVRWSDLGESEQDRLTKFFRKQIFPVLTPLAVDPAHPFPYISGLSLNLAVSVRNPATGKEHFARVKVPPLLSRYIAVDAAGKPHAPDEQIAAPERGPISFVPIEDVIGQHLYYLFPGMEIQEFHTFRVTRNEDVEVEEDDAENLLKAMEKELLRRRFGPPVRLELAAGISSRVRTLLTRELRMAEEDVYELAAPLDATGLNLVADLDRSTLHYPPFVPTTHRLLAEVESANPTDIFAAIRARDILLHHPYDSFSTSVQQFLEQAAADPSVLAIKQTLYRTSGDSPIVDALIDAAQAGKQVLALVEIKARFDEQNNISWARKLEQAGVHVVYGIVGLKTHCKLSLVVRQESDGLRRYSHVGTGNYHPKTARLYTDLGLLTCDGEVGQDLTRLFNQLSGYAPRSRFHRLLVAPRQIRTGLIERIDREAAAARAGQESWIKIKVNSMVDEAIIDALYRASQAGVPIDINVRGICAIRPGVPGLSPTVRVRSILGRFLEHSRVFAFAHTVPGPDDEFTGPEVYIGSADLMHRNLDRRVEALVRIAAPDQVTWLVDLVDRSVADTTSSWWLGPDGSWTRHATDADGRPLEDLQATLIARQRRRRGR